MIFLGIDGFDFVCPMQNICKIDFKELADIMAHLEVVHKINKQDLIIGIIPSKNSVKWPQQKPSLKCEKCDFVALSVALLEKHQRNKMNKYFAYAAKVDEYFCKECNFKSCTIQDLPRHLCKKTIESKFCQACKIQFLSAEDLEIHNMNIHNNTNIMDETEPTFETVDVTPPNELKAITYENNVPTKNSDWKVDEHMIESAQVVFDLVPVEENDSEKKPIMTNNIIVPSKYTCENCNNFEGSTIEEISKHKKSLSCSKCQFVTCSDQNLQNHVCLKNNVKEEPKVPLGPFIVTDEIESKENIIKLPQGSVNIKKDVKEISEEKPKKVLCDKCDSYYSHQKDLEFHKQCNGYINNVLHYCRICKFRSCTEGNVNTHYEKIHKPKLNFNLKKVSSSTEPSNKMSSVATAIFEQSTKTMFSCKMCNFKHYDIKDFKTIVNHMTEVHKQKINECGNKCGVFFIDEEAKNLHKCREGRRVLTVMETYDSYISQQQKQKISGISSCEHCGFKSNSEGMKIHEKTCRQKEVIEKNSLKSEEKDDDSKDNIIVNNENQSPSSYLICKKCDSVFNSRFSLDNHEKNCKKSNILLSDHKPRKIFYDGLPKPGKWVVKLEKVDVS